MNTLVLGYELSDEFRTMRLLPSQIGANRCIDLAEPLSTKLSPATSVVGADEKPLADVERAQTIEELVKISSNSFLANSRCVELTDEQKEWSAKIFSGHEVLLRAFGVQPREGLVDPGNLHIVPHKDFQENVEGASQDGERIGARAGMVQGAVTAHRQVYIDAHQGLGEFIHSLTHELGHAHSRLIVKVHGSSDQDDVSPVSYKRIGLRMNHGDTAEDMHLLHELLDEGIVELLAVLSRINLLLDHKEELHNELGEDGVRDLLVRYSDLNPGMQLILGIIEHMAKSLNTSPAHIFILAVQTLHTDSDIFYRLMERTLSSDFLEAYKYRMPNVFPLALRHGYVANFPENKPYQNSTLDQLTRFIMLRKVQMQVEGLVNWKS